MSAVATTLTLLIVVSYIANYLSSTLPGQMQGVEFRHQLVVQDQISRLRALVLAEAAHPLLPLTPMTPVALGSAATPPFGPPSQSTIGPESGAVNQSVHYQLETVTPANPSWGNFSVCLPGGEGHCAGNGNVNYANLSGNNTTLNIVITGGNNSLVYNLNGDNDSITVSWSGKDEGIVAIVVNGSYDSVTFDKSGSDTTTPSMSFYFFGIHDTFSMSMAGSHSSKGGMNVDVRFIGSLSFLCPYDNYSATDRVANLGAGGSNLKLSVTWWNAVGYVTAPNTLPYPGGSLPSESVTFQNTTGFASCPFLKISSAQYTSSSFGGLSVRLANRYIPPADIGYELGAVLLQSASGQSIMLAPPAFRFLSTEAGLNATLEFVVLDGSVVPESGVGVASVGARVTGVTTTSFGSGVNGVFVATPYYINISTQYPAGWLTYFNAQDRAFPFGASCVVTGTPLPAGTSCLAPPLGRAVTIIAPLYAQTVTVSIVHLSLTLH